jgi:dolichol-phosphate mannosyltransferase
MLGAQEPPQTRTTAVLDRAHARCGVLIPARDEAANALALVDTLSRVPCIDWVLFVVDKSSDGTERVLHDLAGSLDWLHVYYRWNRTGLGTALLEGMSYALEHFEFERLVQMDADLSHDPAQIPALLAGDADLVIGSRYVRGGCIENWPLARRAISRGANRVARFGLGLPTQDVTSGFRVYSRDLASDIVARANCGGYELQVEGVDLAQSLGYSIAEVPIRFQERGGGESKLNTGPEIYRFLRFVAKGTVARIVRRGKPGPVIRT